MNREFWLSECMTRLRPDFDKTGFPLPENIRATCGWPSKSALAIKKKRLGEMWASDCSGDGHCEVFVSPSISAPIEVAAILVHELVHCAVGVECNHKGPFKKCAIAIGLEGPMTATKAGDALQTRLREIATEIGDYPHATLDNCTSNAPPKQTTRMLKIKCTDKECGCIVRMTAKWRDEVGPPTCGCSSAMAEEAPKEPEPKEDA